MPKVPYTSTAHSGGVSGLHPEYGYKIDMWTKVRDCYEGEDTVKEAGTEYLKPTSGMVADGMKVATDPGSVAYKAYVDRAVLPEIVFDAVEAMLGVMHHKPPIIELPASMEPLMERATLREESLPMLLRRINEAQLITGRCGLLADMPKEPELKKGYVQASGTTPRDLPYLALYEAETITNWDQGRRDGIEEQNLNLVIVRESEFERQINFSWKWVDKYRVMILGETDVNEPVGDGIYRVGVFRDDTSFQFNEADMITPAYRGNQLNEIPFTFINACDIVPTPDKVPLLGLANLVLTIYRGEADYRQNLFMQGQDTLVVIGGSVDDEELRVGAGGRLDLTQGADAKYIGVESQGLSEQREALVNDYNRAMQKGGQLMDSVSRERESGDALKVRVAARTATLNQIALTGAFGLENSLKQIARWIGANPEEVSVQPNLDFVDNEFKPEDLVKFITAKSLGAPVSYATIHSWMEDKDITEFDFEEEVRKIEEEDATLSLGSSEEDLDDDDEDDNGNSSEGDNDDDESDSGDGGDESDEG